jgi:hypothetical protein
VCVLVDVAAPRPEDVPKAAELMNAGGDGLSGLGKHKAITPQYYVLAVKPLPVPAEAACAAPAAAAEAQE